MRFSVSGLWRGLAVACALLLLIPLASCTPDARAGTLDDLAVTTTAEGDSILVRVPSYTVHASVDSGVFVAAAAGQASQRRRVAAGSAGSMAFTFAAPATEGATVTGSVTLTSYKSPFPTIAVTKNWSYTRPVGPNVPPTMDTVEVEVVETALGRAPVLDSVQIVRVTGATCDIERRDYYGYELLIVLDPAAEAAGCEVELQRHIYNSGSHYESLLSTNAHIVRRADSTYAGLWPRLQAKWDSVMDGLLPVDNRWCALCERDGPIAAWPVGRDTVVAQPRGSEPPLLAIAEYRQSHPGFTWP